jgi:hypothetical protein
MNPSITWQRPVVIVHAAQRGNPENCRLENLVVADTPEQIDRLSSQNREQHLRENRRCDYYSVTLSP